MEIEGMWDWHLYIIRLICHVFSQDWPTTDDFKNVFPSHFDDFQNIVPAPAYTRRDGVLNIVSHFPKNTIAPDVGE